MSIKYGVTIRVPRINIILCINFIVHVYKANPLVYSGTVKTSLFAVTQLIKDDAELFEHVLCFSLDV